jgi:hypothetical protein
VLEHIEDDRAFLFDLTAQMVPGATLIMTVPALQRLWSQWDVSLGHHRRYNKRMLRSLLAAVPLRVREISYLFPEMLAPALMRFLAPALMRFRTSPAGSAPPDASAEFPDLSPATNELLYRVGVASLRFRRLWPAGTSLLVVADRV